MSKSKYVEINTPNMSISKEDDKDIQEKLISQIHFCRYIFKLIQRINNLPNQTHYEQLKC